MLIKKPDDIPSSEITDEKTYSTRRRFIRGAVLAATVSSTAYLYRKLATPRRLEPGIEPVRAKEASGYFTATGEAATGFADITNYNNFYEFSTDKRGVALEAKGFVTRPWTVNVGGLAHKPK